MLSKKDYEDSRTKKDYEDPRIKRTRELIFEAFKSLAKEKDYESIAVGEITTRAMINRATFYSHFKDKDDLVRKIIDTQTSKLFEKQLSAHTELHFESFAELIRTCCYFLERMKSVPFKADNRYKHYIGIRLQTEINVTMQQWLEVHPHTESDAQKRLTCTVLSWGILGGCSDWICSSSPLPQPELIETIWKIVEPYSIDA